MLFTTKLSKKMNTTNNYIDATQSLTRYMRAMQPGETAHVEPSAHSESAVRMAVSRINRTGRTYQVTTRLHPTATTIKRIK